MAAVGAVLFLAHGVPLTGGLGVLGIALMVGSVTGALLDVESDQ